MQYSQNELIFLGKQVAEGKYVRFSTFLLALALALFVGAGIGRFLFPAGGGLSLPTQVTQEAGSAGSQAQIDASILELERHLQEHSDSVDEWINLGNLYYDSNNPQKAINAYEKALALNPKNTNVLVDCGVMYRALKQYNKALEYFDKALAIDPKHEVAMFNTGIVNYYDLSKKEQGLAAWRKVVQMNPQAKAPNGDLVSNMINELTSR